jgi:flavodoxin
MFRAAVIYASADPTMVALAERVAASLDRRRFSVALKPAAQAAIPDLAASDLVLLGFAPQGRAAVDVEFAELLRALSGVNLAGRVAGLFTTGGEGSLQPLKKALKDTDIHLTPESLLPEGETKGCRHIADWIARLVAQLESMARGR